MGKFKSKTGKSRVGTALSKIGGAVKKASQFGAQGGLVGNAATSANGSYGAQPGSSVGFGSKPQTTQTKAVSSGVSYGPMPQSQAGPVRSVQEGPVQVGGGSQIQTKRTTPVAIPADIIGKTERINMPAAPQQQDYSGLLAGVNAGLGAPAGGLIPQQDIQPTEQPATEIPQQKTLQDTVKEMLGLYQGPVDTAKMYAKAEKQAGIQQKQEVVNSLTNQLNAITAKSQADQLRVMGQGRGIPEAIIGGQQAQISKEAAIQSLPIAAQLSAAQADLESAQSHLDSYFKLITADAQAQTDYYNRSVDMAYNMFSKAEQRQLDAIREQKAYDMQMMRDAVNNARDLSMEAIKSGNRSAFQGLISLPAPDPNSKTFQQDLANYNRQVASYGGGLAISSGGGGKIVKVNGVDYIQNADGSFSIPKVPGSSGSGMMIKDKIDNIDSILNDKGLKTAVGTKGLFGRGGVAGLFAGSKKQNFIAGVEALTSQLTLDSLIDAKAKGATFGALSEGELRLLSNSATKIDKWAKKDKNGNVVGYNINEKDFKREMDKINAYAKRDFLLKGGDPAEVGAISQPDGSIWIMNSDGTLTKLN